jgi:hypothetical protein
MLAACASTPPPTASLQAAQAAISNAERADASRYAAGELGEARTKLASADTAVREERMIAAEQQYNSGLGIGTIDRGRSNAIETADSLRHDKQYAASLGVPFHVS